jgi:hypothetical protein
MTRKSEFASKIQILANRIRCSLCNADSSECLFVVSDEIRFRYSFPKAKLSEPVFINKNTQTLRINKTQRVDTNQALTRICLRCRTARKTTVPNI